MTVVAVGESIPVYLQLEIYLDSVIAGKDRLLTISQLIDVLRSLSANRYYLHVYVTAFVREYFYEDDNTITWRNFVNRPDKRQIDVISHSQSGGNSKVLTAYCSIQQNSIQTPFPNANGFVWGMQAIADNDLYPKANLNLNEKTDNDGGWLGTKKMWFRTISGDASLNFYQYVDTTTNQMYEAYKKAEYMCMRLNRDKNGDGKLSFDEVEWYLPAINQLMWLYVGKGALSGNAQLYQPQTLGSSGQDYLSSTYAASGNSYNLQTVHIDEGANVKISQSNALYRYRCLRNLGSFRFGDDYLSFPLGSSRQLTQDEFRLNISMFDKNALRQSFFTTAILRHQVSSNLNYPVSEFNWKIVTTKVGSVDQLFQQCPQGYHVPNLRELVTADIKGQLILPTISATEAYYVSSSTDVSGNPYVIKVYRVGDETYKLLQPMSSIPFDKVVVRYVKDIAL